MNKLIYLLLFVCMISLVSSSDLLNIGTFPINQDIKLPQTCGNCSFNNISTITLPNSTIVLTNIPMIKIGVSYYYVLNDSYVDKNGNYYIEGVGDPDGILTSWNYMFSVNNIGDELNLGNSLLYAFGLLMILIILIFTIIGVFTVESYIGKFALYWVSHVLAIVFTFSLWQITEGFLIGFLGLAGIFKIIFYFLMIGAFPMIILSLAWIFYIHTMNDEMKKMMERGMDEDEAFDRSRRKKKW